jgi:hypothetical protein
VDREEGVSKSEVEERIDVEDDEFALRIEEVSKDDAIKNDQGKPIYRTARGDTLSAPATATMRETRMTKETMTIKKRLDPHHTQHSSRVQSFLREPRVDSCLPHRVVASLLCCMLHVGAQAAWQP